MEHTCTGVAATFETTSSDKMELRSSSDYQFEGDEFCLFCVGFASAGCESQSMLAPYTTILVLGICTTMLDENNEKNPQVAGKPSRSREADWPAVLLFIHINLLSTYGVWLLFVEAKLLTILLLFLLVFIAVLGMTTGAHRLWAHGTYRATTELKITLMLFQTLAGVGSIYDWVHNHRLHHATFKTDSDPHDCRKGFLYSHILTRVQKLSKQQEIIKESIDMSDLKADSVVMFQKRFYWVLYAIVFLLLPLNAPLEYWNESLLSTLFIIGILRYALVLNATWLLESGVCLWRLNEGEKYPPDSNSVFILNRTSWPEYHYIYPHDYKSGEYGTYGSGCSTAFIRIYAALRLATKLNTLTTTTLQKALAKSVKTKRPIFDCIQEGVKEQNLPDEHYLL